jgi:DNA gyrase subunit A
VTLAGYIKRTPLSVFREQKRGGKGRAGMATKEEDAVTTLFVTSTHNPVLFFSNLGRVYRMKVWRLPEGGPNTKGRPMVNLLPLAEGETISTVLPLPEDESEWDRLHIMFATAHGAVRRNSMAAFTNVPSNGKIAIRFGTSETEDDENEEQGDPTDRLIGVELLTEGDDVLLATRNGKAIRFMATDVREFQSRTSTGVRGVRLLGDDQVISMSILHRVGTTQEEREAYLRFAPWKGEKEGECPLSPERITELSEREQFILTVTENGYGKRSSAYEYRRTNRGGQGITNINLKDEFAARNGRVVASFPAKKGEQIMLVTDQAKLIRMSVGDISVIGRGSAGSRLFRVAEGEHVVSAAKIEESDEEEIEIEGSDEIAPDDGAVVGESELERPADREPEE